jgi:hypothetical protein
LGIDARIATEAFSVSAEATAEVADGDRRRGREAGGAVDAFVVPRPEATAPPALTEAGCPLACLAMTEV